MIRSLLNAAGITVAVSGFVAVLGVLGVGLTVIGFAIWTLRRAHLLTRTKPEQQLRADADALAMFLESTSADLISKAGELSSRATKLREGHPQT